MPFTFKNAQKAVAVFSILGVFLLLATLILIGRGSDIFTFKDYYTTEFNEGYGLSPGQTIKYKGMTVGKIRSMALSTNEDKIRVIVWFNSDYRYLIRQDSVLKVQAALLGGASLVLLPAVDKNSPQLLPGSLILSSDMDKGQELMVKLAEIGPKKGDLTDKVKDILDYVSELRPVINNTLLNVRDSTGSLKTILESLKGGEKTAVSEKVIASLDNVKVMTRNFKELSEEIMSRDNTIGAIVRDRKGLYKKIDNMIDSVDTSLKNVKTISEKFRDTPEDVKALTVLLRENLIELRKVLVNVKNFFGGEKEADKNIKSGDRN